MKVGLLAVLILTSARWAASRRDPESGDWSAEVSCEKNVTALPLPGPNRGGGQLYPHGEAYDSRATPPKALPAVLLSAAPTEHGEWGLRRTALW